MTAYQDRTADIAAAEDEVARLWVEAYDAFSGRRHAEGNRAVKLRARYASVSRRLAWVPARREDAGEAVA